MRIKATILFVVSVFAATATPITYTVAGTGSGVFYLPNAFAPNATTASFTDQPFSFSIKSDTSQARSTGFFDQTITSAADASVFVTVGSESGFLLNEGFGIVGFLEGDGVLDFYNSSPGNAILTINNPAFSNYDLVSSIGPLTGPTQLNPQQREMASLISATFATITFQSIDNVTFEASLATPEPGTLALIGLNLAAFGVWRGVRVKTFVTRL